MSYPVQSNLVKFYTITAGNSLLFKEGWKNLAIIFASGTTAVLTNDLAVPEVAVLDIPVVLGSSPENTTQSSSNRALTIGAVGGTVLVIENGNTALGGMGGGGGGGGDATAANQVTQINQLNTIIGLLNPATAGNGEINTANPGSNYTTLTAQVCHAVTISNTGNVDIEFRAPAGAGTSVVIPANTWYLVLGITDANQIEVRRVDQGNTAYTVKYRWEN